VHLKVAARTPEYPVQDTFTEVSTTSAEFENFSDDDELWLSDLETRAIDLENEFSVWRETRQRALAEQDYDAEPVTNAPHESFRRAAGKPDRGSQAAPRGPVHTAARRAAARSEAHVNGRTRSDERTRRLVDQGRRSVHRGWFGRGHKITVGLVVLAVLVIVLITVALRPGASWPSSVAVVQNEITTACQNPNVVSEPNQVNFACDKSSSQILWVFSLMTSGDRASLRR